jgi:acyl dehydratase
LRVDPERVRRFGVAVGAPEGLGVPPTFATVAEFDAFGSLVDDPELGLDLARVVHGGQEYEWRRPLELSEDLEATARIASIRERGGNGFLTLETKVRDAAGEVVVVARMTLIERAAAAAAPGSGSSA